MYYVKATFNKKVIHKSNKVNTIEEANDILENYIMRANNYIDIKMLGNGRVKIVKYNGDLMLEIIEEENK